MEELSIKNLTFGYESTRLLFNQENFFIPKNSIVKLKGKNGTGKTTFLKIIADIVRGDTLTYHLELQQKPTFFSAIREKRIFISDAPIFQEELNGYENITFYKLLYRLDKSFEAEVYNKCEKFNIKHYLDEDVKNLSLGTRHKLFLAINLSINSELYLLDEPFNSLDHLSKETLQEFIKEKANATFIIVSHEDAQNELFSDEISLKGQPNE